MITTKQRAQLLRQKPMVIWFTGLSGAGKTTLSVQLKVALFNRRINTYLLDGDTVRYGLNKDLGFSATDRRENIRRVAEVCKLFQEVGIVVIAAFISPFKKDRELLSEIIGRENVFEIFVDCPLAVCEQRDVKGLYQKARAGLLRNFTGIDSPYENPERPNLHIFTDQLTVDQSVDCIVKAILPELEYFKIGQLIDHPVVS